MYITENEILNQYEALRKTYDYIMNKAEDVVRLAGKKLYKSVTFIGCGSGYCLCKSAEISCKMRMGVPANSVAAGDLMINFQDYAGMLKNTLMVTSSRSGATSEVLLAIKRAKEELGVSCIAVVAKEGSELSQIADLCLEIPWAFDKSVCQTRNVTNLYLVNLMLIGILGNDSDMLEELNTVINNGSGLIDNVKDIAGKIVEDRAWEKVFVLADSELAGIAEEGALAFNEICCIPSSYSHVLDVRHGMMVLIDEKTLVIIACPSNGAGYQKDLIRDIKARGACVVTVSGNSEHELGSDYHISLPFCRNYGVYGVPFILVPQLISYNKALKLGVNPDTPQGLNPWIVL